MQSEPPNDWKSGTRADDAGKLALGNEVDRKQVQVGDFCR